MHALEENNGRVERLKETHLKRVVTKVEAACFWDFALFFHMTHHDASVQKVRGQAH